MTLKTGNVKGKIIFYIISNILCMLIVVNFLSSSLMPVIHAYGVHQCNNYMTNIINYVVSNQINDRIRENIIIENEQEGIDININVLNSILCNVVMKGQQMLKQLEKGEADIEILKEIGVEVNEMNIRRGIFYEIPLARAFDNYLIGNLGVKIPVRYKLIGQIKGQVVNSVKEYGINNALIEIGIEISYKVMVVIPMISKEEQNNVTIPLVIKLIQGDIPDYFFGTSMKGGY